MHALAFELDRDHSADFGIGCRICGQSETKTEQEEKCDRKKFVHFVPPVATCGQPARSRQDHRQPQGRQINRR